MNSNTARDSRAWVLPAMSCYLLRGHVRASPTPHFTQRKLRTTCDDETNLEQLVAWHRMETHRFWYCFWGLEGSEESRPTNHVSGTRSRIHLCFCCLLISSSFHLGAVGQGVLGPEQGFEASNATLIITPVTLGN